jgi:Carboxypeptidase regulatory-like domain
MCRHLILVLAMVLGCLTAVRTQTITVAQLSGTVVDESGGALPGAEVTVTQTDTALTRFVITNERGGYVFSNLPVGPYKLAARLSGFSVFEQSGIVLAVGDTRSVNVTLKLGTLNETISVTADATLVETRDIGVSRVVSQEQIVSLPLNGRDVNQLIILSGGAVQVPGLTDNRQYPNAVSISVAGGTGNSTQYLVDGGSNNDPQNNTGNAMPFPDALQEFSVESGVRSARFGMSTGATVNAVTRSGTNTFRGSGFIFGRHHMFNAIRYFDRAENGGLGRDDGLKRAQTGGTFGGPISRDRLFFFGGVQVTNTRIAPQSGDQIVPTEEVRRGDFRRIMSAACRGGTARTLGAPFVNNQIDPALYHPISLKIMSMLPLPDPALDPNGCGRVVVAIPNDSDETQYIGRADFQMTSKHRVFGRYFYTKYNHAARFDKANPNLLDASGFGGGNDARMKTFAAGWDYVISQNLLSTTRVSYQNTATLRLQGDGVPTWTSLGVNTFQYTNGNGQDFLRNGTAGWASNQLTGAFYVATPSLSQDIDWNKGSHSVSFGGLWTRPHSDGDGTFQSNGQFTFSGLMTSGTTNANGGLNMADFVLGHPSAFSQGGSQINDQIIQSVGLYVQDVWRVSNRLTLNYGLRYEPYLAARDQNNFVMAFVRENFDEGIRSTVYPNAPVGLVFPGDPGFPGKRANNANNLNRWAPRFGLVWDPKGNAQQTIRAGIGHFYDSPKLWQYAHHMLNAPYGNTTSALPPSACPPPNRNGCPLVFEDPWRYTPGGDPLRAINYPHMGQGVTLPGRNATFPLQGEYVSMPVNVQPMEVTQWNLAYERQLAGRLMADVTYMGSRTRNIWLGYEENPAIYIPGDCVAGQYALTAPGPCSNTSAANLQARALLTLLNPTEGRYYGVNQVAQTYDQGDGRYHSVRLGLQKRMSDGWAMNANYTYSECISQGEPGTDIGNTFPVPLIDPIGNPRPDATTNEGPCAADRPHNLNLSSVLISRGVGGGFLSLLTRDWQLGLIYQARSGSTITPTTTGNLSLTGLGQQRPMIVPGVDPNLPDDQRVFAQTGSATSLAWFNLAAFAPNTPGVWGNVPRGYLRGPGFWNVDAAFSRNINVGNGRRVELRVEAFNLFDHENWANPTVQIGSTNLTNGRVTNTAGDPRIMQFAVKYNF